MANGLLTQELYFTTTTVVDWIDVFTRPIYKQVIIDSLAYCQKEKGLDIYAWVLMTNHLHMVSGVNNAKYTISDILRDFKKYTSKKIVACIDDNPEESRKVWMLDRFWFVGNNDRKIKNYKFWEDKNYIEQINSSEFFQQKVNYIHINPVRQEIVESPEDYLYSSARNYAGMKGLLEVIL
jgi:REP element-mobilizing transposase RayT